MSPYHTHEHEQPPQVGGAKFAAALFGAVELHDQADAEQQGEKRDELQLREDAHEHPRQALAQRFIGQQRRLHRYGHDISEEGDVDKEDAQDRHAAQHIQRDDAFGLSDGSKRMAG
jgi:hypothetical protein